MKIEEFQEIELPVEENGKWIVYAVGDKSKRVMSNAEMHKDMTHSYISHDGGLTSETITCEFDTEFAATACGLTYLLNAMHKEIGDGNITEVDATVDVDESSVMDFE